MASDPMSTPERPERVNLARRIMRRLAHTMPPDERGENPRAVTLMHLMTTIGDVATAGPLRRISGRLLGRQVWPVVRGSYLVGDPQAPVAVCTLTSADLMAALAWLPGVAIAGRVYTPNLGIEHIITNLIANPAIRFLLVCGRDSPLFQPGQALQSLFRNGLSAERRIIGAAGHLPVLRNLTPAQLDLFQRQVELVDCMGERDLGALREQIQTLVERSPGPLSEGRRVGRLALERVAHDDDDVHFMPLRPGGHREPLIYDPKGFFVIMLDVETGEIVLRHYLPDNRPGFLMRGRSGEAMLLGLLRESLITQLSHAGYLGAELAKAEAALRLGLIYEQDRPLRRSATQ